MVVVTTKTGRLGLVPPAQPILLLAFLAFPQAAKPLHGKHRVRASKLKLTIRIHITAGTQVQNGPRVKRSTAVWGLDQRFKSRSECCPTRAEKSFGKRYTSPSGILALRTKMKLPTRVQTRENSARPPPGKYLLPALQQLGPDRLCGPSASAPVL